MTTPSREHDVDLQLLAQSYVLGELDEHATAAFESRLADEQSTREAVEHAVTLITAVATAEPSPTSEPALIRRFPMRARIAAAAAVALGAIALAVGMSGKDQGSDSERLIASWIDFGESESLDALDFEESLDESTDADELAPSWLVAALEEDHR